MGVPDMQPAASRWLMCADRATPTACASITTVYSSADRALITVHSHHHTLLDTLDMMSMRAR